MAISLEQFKRENTQVGATNKPMSLEEFKRKKQTEQTGDQPTAVGGLIRSIAKPFVQTRANVKAIGQTIRGEEPTGIQSKYFGNVAPIKVDVTKSPFEKENLRAIGQSVGTGAEIASYLPVGTGATAMAQIAKEPFKRAIGQSAKIIGKEGVVQGGLGSLGRSMQEGEDLGTTLVNTAGGAALGGLFGAGLGAGTTAISRGLGKTPKSFMDARVDENIRKAMSGTTGDLQTLETRAVRAKNALQRLVNANDIEIPDTTAPLGSGANKRFNISKATPNEFLSAVKAQEQNIAKIGRDSAEEASRMGRIIDTNPAKNVVIQAVKNGDISVPRAKRFMMEIESLGNDPAKVHDWVQNVNIKYAPKYEKGRINQTMTSRMADSIAETFRKELNKNVYRDEYAQAYGDNKELKRLLVSVAKKANRKVDFGDISSDAGLDAAVSILTGNPLFMARTLADSAFRNVIRNIRNQAGLKAMRRAGSVASKIDGGPQMPTGGTRPQLRLPARSSTMGTQMTGGKMNIPRRGAVPLGLGDEPPAQSIRRVGSDVKPYVDNYGEAMSEVESLMDLSRAGYRVFDDTGIGTNVKAVKSTFPTWISEDLRSKELFDRVLGKIKNNMNLIGSKEKRLYNEMKEEVLRRLDDKKNVPEDSLAIKANEMSFEEFEKFYNEKMKSFSPFGSKNQPELEKLNKEFMDFAQRYQDDYKTGKTDSDILKKFWDENNLGGNQAFGAIAGLEIDENGELKFNKEKALMGVGGLAVAKKAGVLPKAGSVSDDLMKEARKYKSAEEFIKAQGTPVYHGGTEIKEVGNMRSKWGAFYMTDNPTYAKSYGGNKSFLNEMVITTEAKLADLRKPSSDIVKQIEDIISPKKTGKTFKIQKPDGSFIEVPETKGGLSNPVHSSADIIQGIKDGKAYYAEMPEVKKALKKLGYDGMITQESKFGANYGVWNKNVIKTKSQLTNIWNSANAPKTTLPIDPLIEEAKKYKTAEEFVKAQGTPIYRGEGGSNVAQGKALLAEGKHFASDSKYPQGFGQVSENIIKPNAKVLDLGDSTFAEISQKLGIPERKYISPKELSTIAKEKGYDVLKYNGEYKSTGKQFTHFVDLTGDSTIPKSQLEDIWKQANNKNRQAGFINPKILGAGALATGAIGATQIPANVSYKRPPDPVEPVMTNDFNREDFAKKIASVENEALIGKEDEMYKSIGATGDLGKYQVSPESLKDWSGPWLGKTYTKDEFLNDKKAQEKFFQMFLDVAERLNLTPEQTAIAWHRGWGLLGQGNKSREERDKEFMAYLEEEMNSTASKRYLEKFNR